MSLKPRAGGSEKGVFARDCRRTGFSNSPRARPKAIASSARSEKRAPGSACAARWIVSFSSLGRRASSGRSTSESIAATAH